MYDRIQGVLDKPVDEGTHIRIPWFQTPTIMDIRTRPRSVSSVTGTKGEPARAAARGVRGGRAGGSRRGRAEAGPAGLPPGPGLRLSYNSASARSLHHGGKGMQPA